MALHPPIIPHCGPSYSIQHKPGTLFQTVPCWSRLIWPVLLAPNLSGSCRKWTGVSCMLCWSQRSTTSRAGSTRDGLWSGCRRTGGYRREAGAAKDASPGTFPANRGEFGPRRYRYCGLLCNCCWKSVKLCHNWGNAFKLCFIALNDSVTLYTTQLSPKVRLHVINSIKILRFSQTFDICGLFIFLF